MRFFIVLFYEKKSINLAIITIYSPLGECKIFLTKYYAFLIYTRKFNYFVACFKQLLARLLRFIYFLQHFYFIFYYKKYCFQYIFDLVILDLFIKSWNHIFFVIPYL